MEKSCKIFFLFILFSFPPLLFQGEGSGERSLFGGVSFAHNKTIDSLFTLLKINKADTNTVNHLNKLCREYKNIGRYDTAMYYGNAALQMSEQLNFKKGIANSYNSIGLIYYYQGNYSEALKKHLLALKIRKGMGDKKGIAISYNNIGIIYANQGNYPEALKNHFTALKIEEDIKDKNGIAGAYNNIGLIYELQGNYPEALKNHFASLKILLEIRDKQGITASYNNIGIIYTLQSDYPEALKNYFAALKIMEGIGDKRGIANAYNNIGLIYELQGSYHEALRNYSTSLKIQENIGNKRGTGSCFINLGSVQIKLNKLKEARDYLNKALQIGIEIGSKEIIKDSYNNLATLDSTQSNWKGAYQHHKLFIVYRDSIDNDETKKKTIQSAMTYEFEKKELATKAEQEKKDIETQLQLQKKNQVIYILAGTGLILVLIVGLVFSFYRQNKLQAKQKNMELQQKLLRTQMNPHFIFNALMSIQSFIYENEPKEAGVFLSRFAKLMRMILETSNEDYISLKKELNTLENYLELQKLRFENKFEYAIEVDSQLDTETIVIPPMLTQPFIENALEHGLRYLDKKGLIKVLFGFDKECITIEVQDNGIGREKAAELKKESETTHQSMAMEISKERLFILNKGHKRKITLTIFDLKDDKNNPVGTKVLFTIPFKEIDA